MKVKGGLGGLIEQKRSLTILLCEWLRSIAYSVCYSSLCSREGTLSLGSRHLWSVREYNKTTSATGDPKREKQKLKKFPEISKG